MKFNICIFRIKKFGKEGADLTTCKINIEG